MGNMIDTFRKNQSTFQSNGCSAVRQVPVTVFNSRKDGLFRFANLQLNVSKNYKVENAQNEQLGAQKYVTSGKNFQNS